MGEASKTRRSAKSIQLIIPTFVHLRDFVPSWQIERVMHLIKNFLPTSKGEHSHKHHKYSYNCLY